MQILLLHHQQQVYHCFSILCCNSDGFVKESMDFFDKKTFMIPFSQTIVVYIQYFTHSLKGTFERVTIIQNTRQHIPTLRRTYYIKYSARVEAISVGTSTTMTSCTIPHMIFTRTTLPLLSVKYTSEYKSAWIIEQGELTGYENITS